MVGIDRYLNMDLECKLNLNNLKLDIVNGPSTETVRQVRLMLNDIVKKFKGMSSSSVKAILDQIYNFIPYTKISKTETGNFTHGNDNYQKKTNKIK